MTQDFNGAVLVLTHTDRADEVADRFASSYFPDSEYHYTLTDATPTSLPVDLRDQIDMTVKRTEGPDVKVLTIYPYAATTPTTLPERPTNGKIPS
jgi:hypothetical protein